ncbi:hypothetical protein ACHQM5_008056 [Ranunculus cassubicifolius]
MDCNKDEASRAKEIAERKFSAKDIAGAKKFALKAQSLYPNLEGLSQMMAVLDVSVAAETKICGEYDWYRILGVAPHSDDETVRKQYRKLALTLHPDKNKSIGAEEAFKLISEAWSVLSDKIKRVAYDQRTSSRSTQPKTPPASSGPSAPPARTKANAKAPPKSASNHVRPPSAPSSHARSPPNTANSPPNTFWTMCEKCLMQFEYARMYLNCSLQCAHCHKPFVAKEKGTAPANSFRVPNSQPFQHHPNSNTSSAPNVESTGFASQQHHPNLNTGSVPNFGSTGFASQNSSEHRSNMNTVPNVGSTSFTSQNAFQSNFQFHPFSTGNATASATFSDNSASNLQQAVDKAVRDRQKKQAAAARQEALLRKRPPPSKTVPSGTDRKPNMREDNKPMKRRKIDENVASENGGTMANKMGMGNVALGSKQGVCPSGGKSSCTRDLTVEETRHMLAEKARKDIRQKLQEWDSPSAKTRVTETMTGRENVQDRKAVATNGEANSQKVHMDTQNEVPAIVPEAVSIDVPDPDFHDFDMDRSENSFQEQQVWAAYDDDDGMPRFYAIIRSVLSVDPFKIRIGWLNPKPNTELGPQTWTKCGFSQTCGDFRVRKYEFSTTLNSFSHKIKCIQGTTKGSVQIYPNKGDVWALYSNWAPDWTELTPDEVIHKYDMVEVVDEYNEEQGVSIVPLIKVAGFKTVFRRHFDPQKVKRIPREEMFRFSHQVPSYLLTGEEAQNAPQGCLELDPASTPLELLQVIPEAKGTDNMEAAKKEIASEQAL